jgi:hypothetical protein
VAGIFDFCPKYMVPKTQPPKPTDGVSMNGWFFSSKPKVPYQRTFIITLQGMRWYLSGTGFYDDITNPLYNAHRLERFYQANGTWDSFAFTHPHLGPMTCRFAEPVQVPEAIINSGGLIDKFDIKLIEHNPGY